MNLHKIIYFSIVLPFFVSCQLSSGVSVNFGIGTRYRHHWPRYWYDDFGWDYSIGWNPVFIESSYPSIYYTDPTTQLALINQRESRQYLNKIMSVDREIKRKEDRKNLLEKKLQKNEDRLSFLQKNPSKKHHKEQSKIEAEQKKLQQQIDSLEKEIVSLEHNRKDLENRVKKIANSDKAKSKEDVKSNDKAATKDQEASAAA